VQEDLDRTPLLRIYDEGRVRVMTLNRPQALNAFSEELYTRSCEAIEEAAADPGVAVLVLTGAGRAFSAGADVGEMAARAGDRGSDRPASAFPRFVSDLTDFPKPLLCAVNGLALGIGVTLLAYADLVFMSTEARIRCPFTDLAVAPEAGSSYLLPTLVGRQNASWLLMSSEWLTAEECRDMGLAWRVCPPETLIEDVLVAGRLLAAKPIASLVETKRTIVAGHRAAIAAARSREDRAFQRLMGQPANLEAFAALSARRPPEFVRVDREHPVDVTAHASEN
jgi:enoyl-CoA hydratase/carnithine racemase